MSLYNYLVLFSWIYVFISIIIYIYNTIFMIICDIIYNRKDNITYMIIYIYDNIIYIWYDNMIYIYIYILRNLWIWNTPVLNPPKILPLDGPFAGSVDATGERNCAVAQWMTVQSGAERFLREMVPFASYSALVWHVFSGLCPSFKSHLGSQFHQFIEDLWRLEWNMMIMTGKSPKSASDVIGRSAHG